MQKARDEIADFLREAIEIRAGGRRATVVSEYATVVSE
jgi:hypothetical protein